MMLLLVFLRLSDPLSCAAHCHLWMLLAPNTAQFAYDAQDFVEFHGDSQAVFRASPQQLPCIDVFDGAPVLPHTPAFAHAFEFWFMYSTIALILVVLMSQPHLLPSADRISWLAWQPPLRPPICGMAAV